MKTQSITTWLLALSLPALSLAQTEPRVQLNYRYNDAKTGKLVKATSAAEVPAAGKTWNTTDSAMIQTVLVTKLASSLQQSVQNFEKACEQPDVRPFSEALKGPQRILPRPIPRPIPVPEETQTTLPADCLAKRTAIADELLTDVKEIQKQWSDASQTRLAAMEEAVDMARALAKNMKDGKVARPLGLESGGQVRALSMAAASGIGASASLNVGTGGAQDYGYFRRIVKDGYVPAAESFVMEGFLAEFPLSLPFTTCTDAICIRPGITVNQDASKMWVQLAMGSTITPATFKRAPLNLSLVLDISGSMSANDGTEKNRLEWAKEAIGRAIDALNADDYVSLIIFDTHSEVLVPAAQVSDKAKIMEKVKALNPRGSTNLHAGLQDGFTQIAKFQDDLTGYENRVILISDAWLNTGVTEDSALTKLVSDYAAEQVGLTAIGLGAQFNQKFIDTVANSRGGNYVYVHSGKDMLRYFESFDFLVTPVAYGLRATLEIQGVDAKLARAYGIPAKAGEPVKELISVPTLFFSNNGGAIVLEYDLKN
jgi:hypothetical protein